MNALDIITQSLIELPPRNLPSAAFSMRCLSEDFEKTVDHHYSDLAFAFFNAARMLYESLQTDVTVHADGTVNHPLRVATAFKKFENVFLTLDQHYPEFADNNWRAQISWRNIQDLYKNIRMVVVRNPRYAAI